MTTKKTSKAIAVSVPQDPSLAEFIRTANAAPILTVEQEQALAIRYHQNNDLDAAKELVLSHLRYVVRVAKGFTGYGLPVSDLVQEGNIGLMKAVKTFDPDRGVRLVSFANHWIKAEIYDYVIRNWKIVKVATTKAQRKLFFNLRKSRKSLEWLTDAETKQLAEDLDVPVKTVSEMEQRLTGRDVAFDTGHDDEDEFSASPAGYLPDMRYNPEQIAMQKSETSARDNNLSIAMEELDDRSRDILQRRWLSESKATLTDLANEYGVSAERIRQIERAAMDQMKNHLIA
ncbi:MAG: RNA polymerase sigma factor RpoH [Arenicella sp.]